MQKRTKAAIAAAASILLLGGGVAAYAASDNYDAKLQQRHSAPRSAKANLNSSDYGDSDFFPLPPCRVADTRNSGGAITGNTSRDFSITGNCGVPSSATAVLLNVTVVAGNSGGWITVYPTGISVPNASNLNFTPNQIIPNSVTSKIGTGGKVSGYVSPGQPAHLIIDIAGYYTSPSYAVVDADGNLVKSAHATAAARTGTGSYTVTFDRDLSGCSVTVSAEDPSVNATAFPTDSTAYIRTNNTSGTAEDHWFDLSVTC